MDEDPATQRLTAMSTEVLPFVSFSVSPEYLGENGIFNPRDGQPPLEAAFQVNVFGTREHYLKLAEFFRAFAEKDSTDDGDFHDHFDGILSYNSKVRLHVILRKDDVGDATWR
jgi:hypothetical protein